MESIEKALILSEEDPNLLNVRGVILIGLDRNEEAIENFEKAFRRRRDHIYMFNKAVAYINLKNFTEAETALKTAITFVENGEDEVSKRQEGEYKKRLKELQQKEPPIVWFNWWFTSSGSWSSVKRGVGIFLMVLLLLYLLLPLFTFNEKLLQDEGRMWWLSIGKNWEYYLVPVASIIVLLISPTLRRLGPQGLEFQPSISYKSIEGLTEVDSYGYISEKNAKEMRARF